MKNFWFSSFSLKRLCWEAVGLTLHCLYPAEASSDSTVGEACIRTELIGWCMLISCAHLFMIAWFRAAPGHLGCQVTLYQYENLRIHSYTNIWNLITGSWHVSPVIRSLLCKRSLLLEHFYSGGNLASGSGMLKVFWSDTIHPFF